MVTSIVPAFVPGVPEVGAAARNTAPMYSNIVKRYSNMYVFFSCGFDVENYGSESQAPLPIDTSRPLGKKEIKAVQKIVGSILFYARAVDMTVLMALSTIASEQTKGAEQTMDKALQVLDYLATHPDATIHFRATDMVMNIHLDTSYLLAPNSRGRAFGHSSSDGYQSTENPYA